MVSDACPETRAWFRTRAVGQAGLASGWVVLARSGDVGREWVVESASQLMPIGRSNVSSCAALGKARGL